MCDGAQNTPDLSPAPTQLLLLARVLTQEGIKRKVGKGNGMQRLAVQLWSQTHEGPNAASALLGCVALGWRHPCLSFCYCVCYRAIKLPVSS